MAKLLWTASLNMSDNCDSDIVSWWAVVDDDVVTDAADVVGGYGSQTSEPDENSSDADYTVQTSELNICHWCHQRRRDTLLCCRVSSHHHLLALHQFL